MVNLKTIDNYFGIFSHMFVSKFTENIKWNLDENVKVHLAQNEKKRKNMIKYLWVLFIQVVSEVSFSLASILSAINPEVPSHDAF